jgi:micrococcal nuclease
MAPRVTRRAFLGLVLLAPLPGQSARATGRVIGVIDGDTLDILTASFETLRVRLSGIDAPELGQAFGRNAQAALSSLVFARSVANTLRPAAPA